MYNLLDEAQENRYDDGSFEGLTEDDEEYGDGEQVACHFSNEAPTNSKGWLAI